MSSGIYIENLPPDITEEGLRAMFAQLGDVQSVKIKTALFSHRPTGQGFVEMSLDLDAYRAINCFDGACIKEKRLRLKEVKPLALRAKEILERNGLIHNLSTGFFSERQSH